MLVLLAGGLALWALAVVVVLAICRAAARGDEDDAGRQLIRAGRRGATASLAAAAVVLPAAPGEASAQERCPNRDLEFEVSPDRAREALLCEIARVRERHDRRRLRGDGRLELAAARHASDMVERSYFSHTSPGGGDLADRARRAGYALRRCAWRVGEILAWGLGRRSTAARIVRAWMQSASHRRVLLSGRYRELGVGLRAGTPRRSGGVTVAAVLGRRHCSR